MAVKIEKEKFSRGKDGRLRFTVQWLADTRAEAINDIDLTFEGLPFAGLSGSPWLSEEGEYKVTANYEGLIEDPDESMDQVEMVPELREVKIENFPDRQLLKDEYGAYEEDGRLKFSPKLPRKSRGGSGLSLRDQDPDEDNPFLNTTTYAVEYEVAVHRFVRLKFPAYLHKISNTVVEKIPSAFEYSGDATSWYVAPIARRKVGNMWDITVRYKEVNPFKDLEALLVLAEKNRRTGGGLVTGSL